MGSVGEGNVKDESKLSGLGGWVKGNLCIELRNPEKRDRNNRKTMIPALHLARGTCQIPTWRCIG